MVRSCLIVALCVWLLLCPAPRAAAQAITLTDDTGVSLNLPAPAQRIIPLYGAFAESLVEMGLADRLLARSEADAAIPLLAALPSIGTHMHPNVEHIMALQPDLVLQLGNRDEARSIVQQLRSFGVPVLVLTIRDFNDLFRAIGLLGVATGSEVQAEELVQSMQLRLQHVAAVVAQAPHKQRVFYEVRYPNLLGAGSASFAGAVIHAAGGSNCLDAPLVADAATRLVRLQEEVLLLLDPDVYLMQQGPMNKAPVPLEQRNHFRTLRAVRNKAVFIVDEKRFSRPGPSSIDAVEQLARLLYPEFFTP